MAYVVAFVSSGYYWYHWYRNYSYPYYSLIPGILVFVGVLIHSLAYLRFYVNHKSSMGMAVFIYSIVTSIMFVAFIFLSVSQYYDN